MRSLILLLVFFSTAILAGDSLVFVIRVDDIQSRNVTYASGIIPFQNAVESRGGKVSWAVIPHRLIEAMNNNGSVTQQLLTTVAAGHEVMVHGYNHTCLRCGGTSHEYFCSTQGVSHTYQIQSAMTDTSLKILNDSLGFLPRGFVPPGHQADTTTWRMLADKGFNILSTTLGTKQFVYPGLYNLAPHQEFTWNILPSGYRNQMTAALKDIRVKGASDGYYMILLHDPFIRPGYLDGLVVNWIGELLDSLNLEYGSKIRYKTVTEAAVAFRDAASGIAADESANPVDFTLNQNHPNPFNPSTMITFSVPVAGNAALRVYDILGRELRTLIDGNIEAGTHSVRFDAGDLSSGIYLYRLVFNDRAISGKMQLNK